MTYASSDPSWLLSVVIQHHHGNSAVASCVLPSEMQAVLLAGDKPVAHAGL